jgi:hypothetical protein
MRGVRRTSIFLAGLASLWLARGAQASVVADFQARFAQTVWGVQQTEAILRSLPQTSTSVSTPDGLSSYVVLLGENVTALNAFAAARPLTDADRKAFADGFRAVAALLQDQAALAGNRGLLGTVSTLSSYAESCRGSVAQLSSTRR